MSVLLTSVSKSVIDSKCRIRRNRAIDLITLKLKSETVKPASKQVARFCVLFTRPPVLTIDTIINFLYAKPCDLLDNLKPYSFCLFGFLIDHDLSVA